MGKRGGAAWIRPSQKPGTGERILEKDVEGRGRSRGGKGGIYGRRESSEARARAPSRIGPIMASCIWDLKSYTLTPGVNLSWSVHVNPNPREISDAIISITFLSLNISLQIKVTLIYLIYLYFQLADGNLTFRIFRELSFLFRVVFSYRWSLKFQRGVANF